MPRFDPAFPLADLAPAPYNPRYLSPEAFERLTASLAEHGVVKPVILNANGTLVAGHQRTKGLHALGASTVPAVLLDEVVRLEDEIRFNLLHNRIETEASDVRYPGAGATGWAYIPWRDIEVTRRGNVPFIAACGDLLSRFGPWGSVVADDQGRIVLNAEYAAAAAALRLDVLAWIAPSAQAGAIVADLTGQYGVYDWSGIAAPVWGQHIIQPKRLRKHSQQMRANKVFYRSHLYETAVLPWLAEHKGARIVDFGSGHGDYARTLRTAGHAVLDYEPYRTTPGAYRVDVPAVVAMVRAIEQDVKAHGLFDAVVLDSVINGTTSLAYQAMVCIAVNALVRRDGVVFVATRNVETQRRAESTATARQSNVSQLSFLDASNVELRFQSGRWLTMRYHDGASLRELLQEYFGEVTVHATTNATIKAVCRAPRDLDPERIAWALGEELNMPYPNDYRHGQHTGAVAELLRRASERADAAAAAEA
jgi:ParB family chromosome partitioning protein